MNTHADKVQNKSQSVSHSKPQKRNHDASTFQFIDNRPMAATQRKLRETANDSPQTNQTAQLQAIADNNSTRKQSIQRKANNTGLPNQLKTGIENLSGYSMDDVKVHYNSDKPAQLQAHAYAQGSNIHLASGQEKHLPHEAWHVVQQKQGRVRPTMQMKGKVNVNDDTGLEKEADVMGEKAIQSASKTAPSKVLQPKLNVSTCPDSAPVQGIFDNLRYPNRKMGVEVTESTAGNNTIMEANPTGFAAMGVGAQTAYWTNHVNLPDAAGGAHNWSVRSAVGQGANFANATNKHNWMQWGNVNLTEDTGEFEWILNHPANPQNMGYYRTELTAINTARAALRTALTPIGNDLIVASNDHPAAPGHAFRIQLGATNAASAQITFESTSAATTKKILYEGLSHGLNKRVRPTQTTLANVTPDIVTAARTSAGRIAFPGIDKELLMAYLYGDLIHKMAIMVNGAGWAGVLAGNAKGWRNIFPKSKPYQVTLQAFGAAPTAGQIGILTGTLNAVRANVINDILALFASKLTTTGRVIWTPAQFGGGAPDPGGHIHTASNAGVAPPGGAVGLATLATNLGAFFTHNGLNLATEYNNVRDGFTNALPAFVPQVARSSHFATHAPGTSGFAAEDRGEVQTSFPGLNTTYDRIKALAGRF